jgi:uncharacterized membrane protein YbhN (UPF0104 family)
MSPAVRRWLAILFWLGLTVAIALALRGLPWRHAFAELRTVRGSWVVAAVIANLVILPLWAMEWRILVPGVARIAFARMFEVVAVTAAVLNSVPFFAGEASGVALLIGRAGLSRGAAVSVLAMDQLLVGFAKLAVLGVAAAYAPLPAWLRAGMLSLVAGFGILLAVLFPLAHRWARVRGWLRDRPSRLRDIAARLTEMGAHFDALRQASRLRRVAILALAKKFAELLAILAVQAAFGLDPSMASALLVLAGLAITTLLPIAPANLGVYEATVFAAYRFVGVPVETALGLAVIQHACFLLPALAVGYLTVTLRQLLPRGLRAS